MLKEKTIEIEDGVLEYLYNVLHKSENIPPLACHPRDLLGLAVDAITYAGLPPVIDHLLINQAWEQYFIKSDKKIEHADKTEFLLDRNVFDENDETLEIRL